MRTTLRDHVIHLSRGGDADRFDVPEGNEDIIGAVIYCPLSTLSCAFLMQTSASFYKNYKLSHIIRAHVCNASIVVQESSAVVDMDDHDFRIIQSRPL